MAEFIEITGGTPLKGSVKISGAKNGTLPMLIASLLTGEEVIFSNVPNLEDTSLLLTLLEQFGAETHFENNQVKVRIEKLIATEASYSLVKALRASFWVLAPLLARGGAARVALPGGDIIGARPVDIHLAALTQMGADIKVKHGVVYATAPHGLKAANIQFRFPSVGATHQVLMAAALTRGTTVIEGAAREPEVVALVDMLIAMGAEIEGAGTSKIVVHGKELLNGAQVQIPGDRVEAGTYLLAGVATGGSVTAQGITPSYFGSFLEILDSMGVALEVGVDYVTAAASGRLKPVQVSTAPFPAFATDLQAPLMAALTLADGESSIEEHMFEGRFGHASELCRMGAQIKIEERTAIIKGVDKLCGAPVEGFDIRAAASLVIAGLAAEGTTQIYEPHHLRRGYDSLEKKLTGLGAKVGVRVEDAEDFSFAGC